MDPTIHADGLTKFYGARRGIEELDLEVMPGEVFGFLGPNGAGKTTTIRILMDLIRPTRGSARIFGLDARADSVAIRARTGYLPGDLTLYENMSGRELLAYAASLRGGVDRSEIDKLAERFGLDVDDQVASMSTGNRQKVGLVQAFMHQPELLVLDEPTAGLDPLMQHEFNGLLRERVAAGATVFLSSHFLAEVERVCDRVGLIRDGRLAAVERISTLKQKALRRIELRFASPVPAERFEQLAGVIDVVAHDGSVRITVEGDLDAVVKAASAHHVIDVIREEPSLEEIFLTSYAREHD